MRSFIKIGIGLGCLVLIVKIDKEWRSYAMVPEISRYIREYFVARDPADAGTLSFWKDKARDKAILYNELIKRGFLDDGMVVNRTSDGTFIDHCDSLLFSSLRYVALSKLGLKEDAMVSWNSLLAVESAGRWRRHPKCPLPTSRDMFIGVLTALTSKPPQHRRLMTSLLDYTRENRGFIDDGPIDVSYLSPGSMMLLNQMAKDEGIAVGSDGFFSPPSFPTLMLDMVFTERGYGAHLSALVIWIELELKDHRFRQSMAAREPLPPLSPPMFAEDALLSWYAQKLVEADPENMFFRWLRLKAAGALTPAARVAMLKEIMQMEQFPVGTLPQSCQREADYLWQRDSLEYQPVETSQCTRFFSGVDFMWMTALLVDDDAEGMIADNPP